MSKIRIYIKPEKIGKVIVLTERDVIHKIRDVLRLKKGEAIYIFDGEGKEYIYKLEKLEKRTILAKREVESRKVIFPSERLTLAFPLVKEEKINFILQKSTELGIRGFIPFTCERSFKVGSCAKKLERWRKIIIEACRQSERLWIPSLQDIVDFKKVIAGDFKIKLAASIAGRKIQNAIDKEGDILFIVGPTGDFSPREYKELEAKKFNPVNLSPHLLRTETAAVIGVGLVNYFLGRDESR